MTHPSPQDASTSPTAAAPAGSGAASNAPRRRGFDPHRFARKVRRAALPLAIVGGLLFWWCFGVVRVPPGMDSIPKIPPGSVCLVDKRGSAAKVGDEVFVDLDDGTTLLTRVVDVTGDDRLVVANDNQDSRLPDSRTLGTIPRSRVSGVVITAFPPDVPPGDLPRGK